MHDNNSTEPSENTIKGPIDRMYENWEKTEPRPAERIHTTNYADREVPIRQLYAIIDSVTQSIVGGIQLHMNTASAIRTLYDIATGDTMVHKHPLDFDLWLLGALGNDHRLNSNLTRIISGAQIEAIVKAASHPKPQQANTDAR